MSEDQDSHLNLPALITKQQELIQRLRRQLATAERDVANEAWVRNQLMQSFSWRITSPVRLAARVIRSLASQLKPAGATSVPTSASPADVAQPSPSLGPDILEAIQNLRAEFLKLDVDTFLTSQSVLEFPASTGPQVTVILKISHRRELAFASLSSLAREIKHGLELVIVDGTAPHNASAVLARVRGVETIRSNENGTAAMRARGKYILFLLSGAHLLPGTLDAALATASSSPEIGAVGGRIIRIDGSLQEAGRILWQDGSYTAYGHGDRPSAPMYMFRRDVDCCSTGFLLTPRELFHRVGGFTDEIDYCRRLTQSGMRVVYEPGATVLHHDDDRGARDRSSPFPQDAKQVLNARMADRRRRILFLEDRPPHCWLGTGYPRAHAILEKLLSRKFFVTFYPLIVFTEEWSEAYTDISREVEIVLEHGPDLLEEFLSERRGYYETILVSRPHNMQVLFPILEKHPDWFADVTVIYDAEAVFATREIARRKLAGYPMTEAEASTAIKSEMELAAAADLVISVSESERETFVNNGIGRVEVLGHGMRTQPSPNAFEDRAGFLFVGAIKEVSPNSDSVIWFVEEILPIIQARLGGQQVRVTIAGVCDSARVRELASPVVRITGIVDDLSELYNQARVFIAPTRYSAGLPHKVHEAAAHGLPTVVTPLLADQLKWRDGSEIAVGMDARSFAEACVRIHENRQQWQDLRTNALARVERECSVEAFDRQLETILRVAASHSV